MRVMIRQLCLCLLFAYGNTCFSMASELSEKKLKTLQQVLSPSVATEAFKLTGSFTFQDLTKLKLKDQLFEDVYINDFKIKAPTSYMELMSYLDDISSKLDHLSSVGYARFQYGNKLAVTLKLPFLGRGQNGAVYEIVSGKPNENKVIKITLPKYKSLYAAIQEYRSYEFWQKSRINKAFSVPKEFEAHKGGLFRIMEKNEGVTLTKAMLKFGMLSFDPNSVETLLSPGAQMKFKNPQVFIDKGALHGPFQSEIKKIDKAMMDLVELAVNNPEYCTSLSPNNIHVTFEDDSYTTIKSIDLVDIGPVHSKLKTYKKVQCFDDYMKIAQDRLVKYLTGTDYQFDLKDLLRWQGMAKSKKVAKVG